LVLQVMSSFRPVDKELKDKRGGLHQLRIVPYRTPENKIDGAVITIVGLSTHASASQ
jgi:hypothetical protein